MENPPRKVQRLRLSSEFRRVREEGQTLTGRWILLGVWLNPARGEGDLSRFGVVTSRKVGNAVNRNLVRRRIRAIHQSHEGEVLPGVWCVVVARFRAAQASYAELEREWMKLARRAGVLR